VIGRFPLTATGIEQLEGRTMEPDLTPVELLGSTLGERIAFCREMAAEANRLAAEATGEERAAHLNLSRLWSDLATAMETSVIDPRGSRSTR
jgi:hypothetical protein